MKGTKEPKMHIPEWKEQDYILFYYNYMPFCKGENYRYTKTVVGRGWKEKGQIDREWINKTTEEF